MDRYIEQLNQGKCNGIANPNRRSPFLLRERAVVSRDIVEPRTRFGTPNHETMKTPSTRHALPYPGKNSQPDQALDQKEEKAGNAEILQPGFQLFTCHNQ